MQSTHSKAGMVWEEIINEVKASEYFSVRADETKDVRKNGANVHGLMVLLGWFCTGVLPWVLGSRTLGCK